MADKNLDLINQAAQSPEVKKLYFNGFALGLGGGDINIVLLRNGQIEASVNCSYTVGKTLAQKLASIVQILEAKTSNVIMTTDQIGKATQPEEPKKS